MDKNTVIAGVLSFLIIFAWMNYANKKQNKIYNSNSANEIQKINEDGSIKFVENSENNNKSDEEYNFTLENENQKLVLDKNGNFKNIFLKEKNGNFIDLAYKNSNYLNISPKIIYNKTYFSDKNSLNLTGKMENNLEKALEWYKKSAEQNYKKAQNAYERLSKKKV